MSFHRSIAAALGALALAAVGAGAVQAQSDDLPEGPGKADVAATCTLCHGASTISARHRSPEEWADVVARMKGMGAVMDADKEKVVVAYLNTSLGTAPAGAPAAAPGTAPTAAPGTAPTAPTTTDPAASPAQPATPAAPASPATPPAPQK